MATWEKWRKTAHFLLVRSRHHNSGPTWLVEWCVTQSWRHLALSPNSLFNGNLQGIRDFSAAKITSTAALSRRNLPLPG